MKDSALMAVANIELNPGAIPSAFLIDTEAKCDALLELAVDSRCSSGHGACAGTDLLGVAYHLGGNIPLNQADKPSKTVCR